MAQARPPVTMLTFAPTLDSEQVRMLLHYYRVPYREKDHLMPWAALLSSLHGGGGEVPVIYRGGVKLAGPRPIAGHYDQQVPQPLRLIPTETAQAQQFEADSVSINLSGLGNATVNARTNLDLNLSGLGSVIVYGKPLNRNVSVDGLGRVSWK